MGTGERGKGQRRRQKALREGKSFDKKNNTFREHEVSFVEKALKADTMLEAPSSFKRFMRAQEEIKMRQMRHEIKKRRENGLDINDLIVEDDAEEDGKNGKKEEKSRRVKKHNENKTKKEQKKENDEKKYEGFYDEDPANAREYTGVQDDVEAPPASKTAQKTGEKDDDECSADEAEEEEDSERNANDNGGNSSFSGDYESEDVEEEVRRRNMPDKGEEGHLFSEGMLGDKGRKTKEAKKTKYKSLRERKKEKRAQARIQKKKTGFLEYQRAS